MCGFELLPLWSGILEGLPAPPLSHGSHPSHMTEVHIYESQERQQNGGMNGSSVCIPEHIGNRQLQHLPKKKGKRGRKLLALGLFVFTWPSHYQLSNGRRRVGQTEKRGSAEDNNLVALHFKYDQARRRFVKWAQNEIAVVPDFHKRILFSDEAHFWLNGYVNKQNCRIWSEANPQVYVETPLHPEKLTVWCALWAGGIIGPSFFKNDEGHSVTVNCDRYRAMITNFFIPELNNHDVQKLWFQQDGATCHTARATIDLLRHVW
ncbi:uncharacterized protein TNCV_2014511 [Trichonephila clavipes]|nr:uncharacterized protein TNCV_2014511 [Trichonephila clavipes]